MEGLAPFIIKCPPEPCGFSQPAGRGEQLRVARALIRAPGSWAGAVPSSCWKLISAVYNTHACCLWRLVSSLTGQASTSSLGGT